MPIYLVIHLHFAYGVGQPLNWNRTGRNVNASVDETSKVLIQLLHGLGLDFLKLIFKQVELLKEFLNHTLFVNINLEAIPGLH